MADGPADISTIPKVGRPNVVIVTGISGAGKSTALRALEDAGFVAVDNPPLTLASALIADGSDGPGLAIGVDIRSRGFSVQAVVDLLEEYPGARLVFLDCEVGAAIRRFTETRRRHPIADAASPAQAIRQEKAILDPLRIHAERLIDTTLLSARDLRRLVQAAFSAGGVPHLSVAIDSFSFAKRSPCGADLVFDVRFLANPHYQDDLRPLTGLDRRVNEFVESDPSYDPFMKKLEDMVAFLLPLYEHEGKSYLTVGIGCTGGRHRSVTVAEHLGKLLTERGWPVQITHREIERRADVNPLEAAS
jgi:UPF0042 nucleotide-binding protein